MERRSSQILIMHFHILYLLLIDIKFFQLIVTIIQCYISKNNNLA